jgi:beta-aspartyl-peptidase (threonine type)
MNATSAYVSVTEKLFLPTIHSLTYFDRKMKNCALFLLAIAVFSCKNQPQKEMDKSSSPRAEYAIALHGGAGTILKENMTPEKEKMYLSALDSALTTGEKMLQNGADALDVVEAVIVMLEDNPLFNAGKGAVFNHEGRNELDASIMDGKTRMAGAVGSVSILKNPIRAARAVMEKSEHVMLIGKGAEKFALENGLDTVPADYFFTQERWDALQKILNAEKEKATGWKEVEHKDSKFGTVGCAVLDKNGNLAAGTSTGGMTNKRWNRLGDAPIIGAGTYADNNTCAVSSTGHGEYFIRYTVARDIAARMEYLGESLEKAADFVVNQKLKTNGGEGGVIAVDKNGNVALPHNTPGMYRAYAKPGDRSVKIYRD